ncbi:MAG TPA: hypothetical protein VN809_02655 [Telmatospirillum sp.]|nr:hypothetical protein [Telmatospirillum sp.]
MSTTSMQPFFAKSIEHFSKSQNPCATVSKTPTDALIEASDLRPGETVMVVGRALSDHLVGLAHRGCGSAMGVHPDVSFLRMEDADVVWFTDVADIGAGTTAMLRAIGTPRLVAIELLAADSVDGTAEWLRQLAAMGLVHCAYFQAGDRMIVTAARPQWLRWVA